MSVVEIKRAAISILIHLSILCSILVVNSLFPSNVKYAPDNGIFIYFAWLIYTPLAFINSLGALINGDKSRLYSFGVHLIFLASLIWTTQNGGIHDYLELY